MLAQPPAAALLDRAAGERQFLQVLLDGAALGVLVEELFQLRRIDEAVRHEFRQRRGPLLQVRRDRLLPRGQPRTERLQQREEGLALGDHALVVGSDPHAGRNFLHALAGFFMGKAIAARAALKRI